MDSERLLGDFPLPSKKFKKFVEQTSSNYEFPHKRIVVVATIPVYFYWLDQEVNCRCGVDSSEPIKPEIVVIDYRVFTSFNISLTTLKSLKSNNSCIEDFLSSKYCNFRKRVVDYKFSLIGKGFRFIYFGMFFVHKRDIESSIKAPFIKFDLCGYVCDSPEKFYVISNLDYVFDII